MLGVHLKPLKSLGATLGWRGSEQVDHGVTKRGQHLRCDPLAHPARILAKGHIPNVMQLVLDAPVVPNQGQKCGRVGPLG
ncbi:hypothetical protein VT84_17645 [Gemmata sp. SH-PL17]|nr:hypothetical protein VT84_17645 [Gemmata sp. SH-PL17]